MGALSAGLLAVRGLLLFNKYRDSTMIPRNAYIENVVYAGRTLARLDGAVVECGTWKGGMAAALIEVGGPRKYVFFDSFEGLPPARAIDGQAALAWQSRTDDPSYLDNCSASREEFEATIARAPRSGATIEVHQGYFEKTMPGLAIPPIAVLRLDGDWYDSTMTCLTHLWDAVVPGGLILVDDYHTWDGCSRAVHDFLSDRKAPERILQGRLDGVAMIRKQAPAAAGV